MRVELSSCYIYVTGGIQFRIKICFDLQERHQQKTTASTLPLFQPRPLRPLMETAQTLNSDSSRSIWKKLWTMTMGAELIDLTFPCPFRTCRTSPRATRRRSPTGGTAHLTTPWSCTSSYLRCRWGAMAGSSELNCGGNAKAKRSNLAERFILRFLFFHSLPPSEL